MEESFERFYRTGYCGELGVKDIGKLVSLCGWVHRIRNHGGVIFIDLRDREGVIQVVVEEEKNPDVYDKAAKIKPEWVIGVKGKVRKRPPGTENPKIKTGFVEVLANEIKVFSKSDTPPFPVDEETPVSEEIKLKYRYLDLRMESMRENIIFRHKAYQIIRNFLSEQGFIEIETPFLTKSTPEGARDFLVPSRLHSGKFYALPQSPQLFKQILMIAGFDKYFQIARCFRDEDLRADRQPEFTQIDLEMSFVDEDQVMSLSEELIATLFKELLGVDLPTPFERISYEEALERYGTDKPDRRFSLELTDLTDVFTYSEFRVFKDAIAKGGVVKAIKVHGINLSRKDIEDLTEFVKGLGAKGLAWIRREKEGFSSPIVKFLTKSELELIDKKLALEDGDVVFFSADLKDKVYKILGSLRLHLAKKFSLIKKEKWDVFWVTDFPLIEWDEEEGRFVPLHHPFTAPREEDIPRIEEMLKESDMDKKRELASEIKSRAYDLIINGEEVGGGSIRIHSPALQEMVFELLNISKQEANEKFGFLIEALKYGAPPHGGIAFGLDRLLAIMRGLDSIRDVIAFPKTQKGICPLTSAPDYVSQKQLREVHIKVI
jgi:aspartyl-tRNA synthetase